jgi:hypothetical protein
MESAVRNLCDHTRSTIADLEAHNEIEFIRCRTPFGMLVLRNIMECPALARSPHSHAQRLNSCSYGWEGA